MIEQLTNTGKKSLLGMEGWGLPATISLVVHGTLIGVVFYINTDTGKPILPDSFNVQIITEPTPQETKLLPGKIKNPIEFKVSSSLSPDKHSATPNSNKRGIKKKLQKFIPLNNTEQPLKIDKIAIYAPLPKRRPKITLETKKQKIPAKHKLTEPTFEKKPLRLNTKSKKKLNLNTQKIFKTPRPLKPAKLITQAAISSKFSTIPPKIDPKVKNLWPKYPSRARRRGQEGTLILRITVSDNGKPFSIKVIKTSGHQILDQAAINAIWNWQFQPAQKRGLAVKASIDLPVVFQLKNKRKD
ncbi:MAG: hypothetical protein CMM83_07145 [Rhodospirillales bacterium]|nr:hypothetical protein [Rhodospirillales bacterium]|tara:strand:- start:724 stop:1620 length:897 start_codon:yes stop_codon:yes gene_type:complete